MASVSVVERQPGPHRLDKEQQILLLKLHSSKKKITPPRRLSWEKMMFAKSDAVPTEAESPTHPWGLAPAGGTVPAGRVMPAVGCGAPAAVGAPRSPNQYAEEGGRRVTAGTRESQTGRTTDGCYDNRDSARDTFNRRDSGVNAMPNGPAANRHKKSHRHRDAASHGKRSSRNGDAGHQNVSSAVSRPEESGGLSLERVTQGRTGVVKLARAEPHRREAWSIFPREMDPRVRTETGEGHRFETKPVKQDWCDACRRQITTQALKCQNCSYTCHLECESRVQLDCNQRDKEPEETPSPRSSSAAPLHKQSETKEEEEGGTKELSEEEVRTRIEEYNTQDSKHGMKLATDGSYTGVIKVHLRLNRPVTVPDMETPGSEGASRLAGSHSRTENQDETSCGHADKRTSFYLPSDCMKVIHIGSMTTTKDVIEGLLKKYMVLDNPRKFALYKQTHRDGQDLFQKLLLSERPLLLRLIAGPAAEQLTFVLKENESEEVEWHAFSLPELQNFLVILQKEEGDRIRAVEQKYATYRQKLKQALQQHDSEPSPVT